MPVVFSKMLCGAFDNQLVCSLLMYHTGIQPRLVALRCSGDGTAKTGDVPRHDSQQLHLRIRGAVGGQDGD